MARFTLPRDLYHGKGSLEALKTLKGTKAFVVVCIVHNKTTQNCKRKSPLLQS